MKVHLRSDRRLAVCGHIGTAAILSDDIEEVTCGRCVSIVKDCKNTDLVNKMGRFERGTYGIERKKRRRGNGV